MMNETIAWNVFFTNRFNVRLLKKFATEQITLRGLATTVNTADARFETYCIERSIGTQYARTLARKALKRRGIDTSSSVAMYM